MPEFRSIEFSHLEATYAKAQSVYNALTHEEQHAIEYMNGLRTKILRQQGYLAALEGLLGVPSAGQGEEDGEEIWQELDTGGAPEDGEGGEGGLVAQSLAQEGGRDNHGG